MKLNMGEAMTGEQLDRLRAELFAEAVEWGERRRRDPDGIWWAINRLDAIRHERA